MALKRIETIESYITSQSKKYYNVETTYSSKGL